MNEQDRQFISRAKKVLDQAARELDAESRAGLTRARAKALNRPRKGSGWFIRASVPAAGLALAAALVFFWTAPNSRLEKSFVSDLELLASEDPIEFYEEIDFCLWLSEGIDEDPDYSNAPAMPAAGSLSDLGNRHEKIGNRGQIFENLQAHSESMGQEFSRI
jgi:hypothetical protein